MSTKIYAIANQKGGVGKTTTCHCLAAGLHAQGKKVLLIDLDPQSNLSVLCDAVTDAVNKDAVTMLELLSDKATFPDVIQPMEDYDIAPASMYLASIDSVLTDPIGRPFKLAEKITEANLRKKYDYIFIDCPPALGTLTSLAIVAADSVIIPAQADILSLQGVSQLYSTIQSARGHANKSLRIAGIVLTRFNARTKISREIHEMFLTAAKQMNTAVFKTQIREGTAIKETQASGENIFKAASNSNVAQDYKALTKEIFFPKEA
ncbi:putative chromosome partitioning ATPase ParA (plasmid) [Selenomonas ruminantium subsp. lactilytica TAM6421]|uniref:Sporulation initiation inhibitor protein Soj n=1 Tax=Selenomonas ruminantium subsp. lactilytica (strain NBRC 103574 / TAM6421) TaxID=927704 RepID=I0GVJ7_SELRL|nr:ParA family protein [Selenomonas ruminantium]BAL84784.1 putative chromosome partitioning ATPase ParA [Selenomonas ruminantium subsp. lactilytica TAM6421]